MQLHRQRARTLDVQFLSSGSGKGAHLGNTRQLLDDLESDGDVVAVTEQETIPAVGRRESVPEPRRCAGALLEDDTEH